MRPTHDEVKLCFSYKNRFKKNQNKLPSQDLSLLHPGAAVYRRTEREPLSRKGRRGRAAHQPVT